MPCSLRRQSGIGAYEGQGWRERAQGEPGRPVSRLQLIGGLSEGGDEGSIRLPESLPGHLARGMTERRRRLFALVRGGSGGFLPPAGVATGQHKLTTPRRRLALPHLPEQRFSEVDAGSSPPATVRHHLELARRKGSCLISGGGGSSSIRAASSLVALARRDLRRASARKNASAPRTAGRRSSRRSVANFRRAVATSDEPSSTSLRQLRRSWGAPSLRFAAGGLL